VLGVVSGLPAQGERGVRFEFDVESAPRGERVPGRVLLWWYRSTQPSSQPEAEPALLAAAVHPVERGIGATGYVRQRGEQRLLGRRDSALDRVEQVREAVRERFHAVLGATPAAGILSALAVGDQRAIAAEEWRLFSRTGVTHL